MQESAQHLFHWSRAQGCENHTFSCSCRDIALKSYHHYECGVATFLDASGLGPVPLLALRTVARFGEQLRNVHTCN